MFSGKARGDTRLSRRPALAAVVASNARDQTTFTLLGRSFDLSFNFQDLAAGRTISSQHSKHRKSLTKGLYTVQDVGQVTVRPVEVM